MTWEELVKRARYYNCEHYSENWFDFRGVTFGKYSRKYGNFGAKQ